MSTVSANNSPSVAPTSKSTPSAASATFSPKPNSVVRFKSIFARIICLHVIVVVLISIVTPLTLYWFLKSATDNLHNDAMREQAVLVANYLVLRSDGSWALDLPPSLHDFYSQAYGRYAYAVIDDGGRVLFSSLRDGAPLFSV